MSSQNPNSQEPDVDFNLPTPTSLLIELRNRQTVAWERFMKLYGSLILLWLVQHGITDRAERKDLSHDICIHVIEHIDQYHKKQNQGGFRAWLKVVVTNYIVSLQRRYKQDGALAIVYEPDPSKIMDPHSTVLETVIKREQERNHALNPDDVQNMDEDMLYRQGLIKLLGGQFSQRDIDIFYQLSYEKKKTAQVAELFNLTTANIKKIRQRVRDYLKEYLGDMDDDVVDDDETDQDER